MKGKFRSRTRRWRKTIRIFPNRRPLSLVLLHFTAFEPVPSRVRRLRDALAERGLAAILFLAGAFHLLPLPLGTTLVSGVPVLLLAWQMMLRRQAMWLPERLLERPLTERHLEMLRWRIVPRLFWLEKFVRPRYWPFAPGQDEFVIGLLGVVLAVLLIVPLPLAQWPPTISITLLALALLQRDGVLLLVGLIAAAISLATFTAIVLSAFMLAENVFSIDLPGTIGE
ncbi:exopolysaccharide biosynthesis protein [Thioalkalivibrio sulfidiphilus]|uniref:exopolysaccharide biosynthesis protein n=1 Tax=Thioalkalivibrio sulfidiphilus TaxID=1033854 RepID=UPI003B36AE72